MPVPIPDSVVLMRSRALEADLYAKARRWLAREERAPGLHASSLLDPRLAYFGLIHGPKDLSDRLVNIFLAGKLFHLLLISVLMEENGINWASDSGSKYSDELGIHYSVDHWLDGCPNEIKTTRKPFEAKDLKDLSLYVEQLLIYMACENKTRGYLSVMHLSLRTGNGNETECAYRVYPVDVSLEDLAATRAWIKNTVHSIQHAVDTKNPRELPLCHPFKCGPVNCEYWEECQPEGRYPKKTRGAWKA